MRENNRNSIEKSRKKLPQFTTMNVIDGQASLVIYASLIFYSLTIDNILNIIVLLILAGVSIATLTGNNGILTQAGDAKDKTNMEAAKEKVQVEALGSISKDTGKFDKDIFKNNLNTNLKIKKDDIEEITDENGTKIIVPIDGYKVIVNAETGKVIEATNGSDDTETSSVKPGTVVSKTEKNNYKDSENNTATVPQGFTVSGIEEEQTISTGLVIYDIPEDEIENVDWNTAATKYNQFVWIPVASAEEYQRDFSYPSFYGGHLEYTPENSTFTDIRYLPTDIQPETDDAANNEMAERTAVLKYNGFYIARYETGKEDTKPVSKQNVTVYAMENQISFKTIGKTMYGESSTYVKSAMCSGIQWDMVMKFVDGKTDGNGNTYDVRTVNSTRHHGSAGVEKSGNNIADKVQNIYDLEGNCKEYVAEKNNTAASFVLRGGSYSDNIQYSRASFRNDAGSGSGNSIAFRSVLYIK